MQGVERVVIKKSDGSISARKIDGRRARSIRFYAERAMLLNDERASAAVMI